MISQLRSNPLIAAAIAACRRHFLFALGFSALVNILYLAPTLYMMQVYDRVVTTGGLTTLGFITVALMLALATQTVLDKVRARLLARASLRLDRLLAGEVLGRLYARLPRGSASARVGQALREFDVVRQTLTGPAVLALFDAPWTPVYVLVSFMLHWVLGLLAVAGGVTLFILAVLNDRATKSQLKQASEASANAYAAQEVAAANADVVRALGMREALVARQLGERRKATDLQAAAQFEGGAYSGLTKFVRQFLQSIALGVGAWLAVEHQISSGSIIAASVLLSRALQPVEQLVGAWSGLVNARTAFATVDQILSLPAPDSRRTELPTPNGLLSVETISVRAPRSDKLILKSIAFTLRPGEALGLVGPTGSGKTTLAGALCAAAPVDAGVIRLDGADFKDWDGDRLGRHIGYLPQSCLLFAGSVRDNISRFEAWRGLDPAEADARAVAAAQAAGAHEMILRLPGGYDAPLGLGGLGLSAGQTQRIALARALYGDPALVVLDEPNSNLDADGEAALMRAIAALKARGAAVVIAAHRASILAAVDALLVLNEGAVDLMGPRDEVIAALNAREPKRASRPTPIVVSGGGAA